MKEVYTHYVDFFDSMTMSNRTELCRVTRMYLSDEVDTATVEVDTPVRKSLQVPLNCLTCRFTGERLPFYDR